MSDAQTIDRNKATQETLIYLDPNSIKDPKWDNPRSEMPDSDYLPFLESVRARGVHTPIFIRMVDGEPEIVAGWTRRRAAREAQLPSIPCLVKTLNDQEAFELAVSENVDRTQMSVLDEAKGFKKIVADHNGNVDAAASHMGWSKNQLERALQLLRTSDKVQSYIGKKQSNGFMFSVGHAACLSELPESIQDRIVEGVINEKMTITKLKDTINKAVKRPLENAPFCQNECKTCPYNTLTQVSLFADENGSDCTNPPCFSKKTKAHFEAKRLELEKEHGRVILLSTIENPVQINEKLVGKAQFNEGCLSCAKFGAVLADKGVKEGQVISNACLDSDCATKHNEAVKAARKAESAPKTTAPQSSNGKSTNDNKKTNQSTPEKRTEAKVHAAVPKRLIHTSQEALRKVGVELLLNLDNYHFAVILAALQDVKGSKDNIEQNIINNLEKSEDELDVMITSLVEEISTKVQRELVNIERTMIRAADAHCPEFTTKAIHAWIPTEKNLGDMTKAIRQQALEKSGFAEAFKKAKSDKEYTSLLNKRAEDAIKDILDFQFDWTNFAPDYYLNAIKKQQYN
ncbi:ParB/RepB/Spo0J family partition protein [Vibrio mediterranei]